MYIMYWVSATGDGRAFTVITENEFAWNDCLSGPSDSVWIVPGTVGVDD